MLLKRRRLRRRVRSVDRPAQPLERARIGPFEVNFPLGELRKHGIRLKIHDQPLGILEMLVSRAGRLVTREEIRQRLWASGTFVDFDNGLNSAVNRLRTVLGDSAESPKFIETIPRRGYRLIAPVEQVETAPVGLPEPPSAKGRHTRPRRFDHSWLWVGAAAFPVFLLAAVVTFLAIGHFSPQAKSSLNLQARDGVLITSFDNRTGEPVFDGTLEYALERELSNAPFVNLVPRGRVDDVLRLMRRPLDSKIDAQLGREICLRDGGIPVLLTGRVEKLGTTYVLTSNVVDPFRGTTVASISEEDPADTQTAAAVRRLADRVRETLGERRGLIEQGNAGLEKVTTPSLRALQLYTRASQVMRGGNPAAAGALLKEALAEDADFASAHLLLAWTYQDSGSEAQAWPEFQRALDLSGSVSERERLFIVGSYNEVKGDMPRAIDAYEALFQLYPDHVWGANSLLLLYHLAGRWDDEGRLSVEAADLHPENLPENIEAACVKCLQKDMKAARAYMDRVEALERADPHVPVAIFIEELPIFRSWAEGEVARTQAQLQGYASRNTQDPIGLAFLHLALGEISEAEKSLEWETDPQGRSAALGIVEFLKGDLKGARKDFMAVRQKPSATNGLLLSVMGRCGLWNVVDASIRKFRKEVPQGGNPPPVSIMQGELALARGKATEGIELLEEGRDGMRMMPTGAYFLGSEALAQAYENRGDLEAALRVLQEAQAAKGRAFSCTTGPMLGALWLRTELELADLYRKMGRASDAEKVEDELRKMLAYADADHPVLLALQRRAHGAAAVASR